MTVPTYQSYRNTHVDWLGQVPSHWRVDRLKASVASSKGGVWGDEPDGGEDDIACIRVADFDRNRLSVALSEPTLRKVAVKDRNGRLIQRGDLLLEKSGGGEKQPVGVVVLYEHELPAVCSNFVARVQLKAGLDPSFWRYVHAAAYARGITVRSLNQTSGIQNLDQDRYFEEQAPFPPMEEQVAIAAFLGRETSKIDALVEEQRRLIALLKEKRQAVISHAATKGLDPTALMKDSGVEWLGEVPRHWQVRNIASLSSKITNGFVGPTRDILFDEGVRYLQSLHIKNGVIRFDHPYYVSPSWSEARQKSILARGDVLIVQTGDIGQVAVVPDEFVGCNCHALIIVAPHHDLISGDWLSFALRSDYGRSSLLSIQTGALHPHLNCGNVKFVMIPVPPPSEQSEIISRVDGITAPTDALIAKAEEGTALLNERRAALISAAVTGKIDVRGLVLGREEAA